VSGDAIAIEQAGKDVVEAAAWNANLRRKHAINTCDI
jgi:hypothetical protein